MAQLLGQVSVGSVVKLNENGSPTNYIVVNQGIPGNSPLYDASCNGTWLLRQDCQAVGTWNDTALNVFNGSAIQQYMNTYIPGLFDSDIQAKIVNAKIPYCIGNDSGTVNSGANGIQVKCFPLSGYEMGMTQSWSSYLPEDGYVLAYFSGTQISDPKRIANFAGSPKNYWLRSPVYAPSYQSSKTSAWDVTSTGALSYWECNTAYGYRPAVIFPQNLVVLDDGTLTSQTLAPTSLTVPSQAMQGQSIPINWTASANADSYQLQRKADSGQWETIYTGSDLTFTDTAGSWSTVQYQVAAGLGGEYGEYATSAVIPVVSASALVISGTNEDLGTITADIPYTVSSDTGNQITLTRTVNGVQYASATISSGFAYNIPVMELPTGTGTIVITASVQATSGPVATTRTWTYTKAPISFPDAAGVGVLQKDGQNFLPATLAELIRTNPFWGGSLSTALEMLTGIALNGVQIEVGSYTGTGSYGNSSPNTYTFSKGIPKFVIILGDDTYISNAIGFYVWGMKYMGGANGTSGGQNYASTQGNTLSWYSTQNVASQLNTSRTKYYVVSFY